ncbi:hypothetical protein ACGF0D_37475 [Kitasatospora sp. NPDC048298]|uniref:hypothetical protein n=1 Tax=Kitasatospora sp. NPDC048298 TaxID=3364049 RepID=UPI0037184D5D
MAPQTLVVPQTETTDVAARDGSEFDLDPTIVESPASPSERPGAPGGRHGAGG